IVPCELLGVVEEPELLGLVEVLCAAAAPAIARLSKAERANFFMPSFLSVRLFGLDCCLPTIRCLGAVACLPANWHPGSARQAPIRHRSNPWKNVRSRTATQKQSTRATKA